LYLLQLEEYEIIRYVKQVYPRLFRRNFQKRGKLEYTTRIKITYATIVLSLLFLTFISLVYSPILFLLYILSLPLLIPIIVGIVSFCVSPVFYVITQKTIYRTYAYFKKNYSNTKIIAVTGSYGKTTTKYLLKSLLEHTYTTEIIPDNINTAHGIANFVLSKKITGNPKYLIVEMGAYRTGDIKKMAQMLPPDIAIITVLGDQHLERFGSFENLVKAKNEIFQHSKKNALKYATDEVCTVLQLHNLPTNDIISVPASNNSQSNIKLATKIVQDAGVQNSFIEDTLQAFKPPHRRNEIIERAGVTIIDNSYNISPQTAEKMLIEAHRIAQEMKKKLVVMTAGISEQGTQNDIVNQNLGAFLNVYANRVILHPSIYMPSILKKLTIAYEIQETRVGVFERVSDYVDGTSELLLQFPGHTDLSYI
jgi:UDP-N-acetylmuramoyl-tripeptide--D-alanyl-D-alanine ligase